MNKCAKGFFWIEIPLLLLMAGCVSLSPEKVTPSNSSVIHLSGAADQNGTVSPSSISGSTGTLLAVPSKEQLKKNNLDATVLGYLETGSPDSIRMAVERINADSRGMTDQNRIALAVAGELLKLVYPAEPLTWSIPSVSETDPYIGAIRTAQMGLYDYNTGNTDFFSLVLPSLVLLVSNTPGDYYADAESMLSKAASLNEKSVLPPYFLALLAERQNKTVSADEYYKRAWDLDASCYPAGVAYTRSLIRKGSGKEALAVARALAARYPDSIPMVQLCAEASFVLKDWSVADPYVLKILKAEPDNTLFLLMRARILLERKEYLKASSLLDAFATTNRSDKNYLLLRSRVIREWNKNLVSATSILQEAQRLYPDDIEVLLASAEVCYQTNQTINQLGGRDFVFLVLKKESENRSALALLVTDYITSFDWQNAIKSGEHLVQLYPSDETRALLLRSYLGGGQSSRAGVLAKSLYNVADPTDEITALYIQTLLETGDTKTASSLITSRMASASSSLKSILYYYQSKLTSDSDEKLSALRSSLLADPRNLLGLFAMYQWYLDKTDYRKAQYYLKQVIALDPMNKKYSQLLVNLELLLAR